MTKSETDAAKLLGRKGGLSKSERKAESSRQNGKLGGKPKECVCGHSFKRHNEIGECTEPFCSCVSPRKD